MHKTNIPADLLQAALDSASNAGEKGLSQFFTPLPFGRVLARALPAYRPVVTDLTCGAGHLLRACANDTTHTLLGADLDACTASQAALTRSLHPPAPAAVALTLTADDGQAARREPAPLLRLQRDLTLLYPDLVDCGFMADLIVLNPPYRLFWPRLRLADTLAECPLWNVTEAFAGTETGLPGACPRSEIDSTVATLLIALHLLSPRGEGLLIGNHATIERLLFSDEAPHSDAGRHVWGRLILPGNPMTGRTDANFAHDETYHTEVLYFSRGHMAGPQSVVRWTEPWHADTPLDRLPVPDRRWLRGMTVRPELEHDGSDTVWLAVKEQHHPTATTPPFNLWLAPDGAIATQLTRFEELHRKTNKAEATRLHALRGQRPMQIVMQRDERKNLLHAARDAGWRVCPQLLAAVELAIAEYAAARAPLYPLPKIQRLGYVDEHDHLICIQHLGPFRAGEAYPLRTQTVKVTRRATKPNNTTGEPEQLEYEGYELGIYLRPDPVSQGELELPGPEWSFLDASLRDASVKLADARRQGRQSDPAGGFPGEHPLDFTLQELCSAFEIPDVPDVSVCRPDEFAHYSAMLAELERQTSLLTAPA